MRTIQAWGTERGVDVRELVFRAKTVRIPEPHDPDLSFEELGAINLERCGQAFHPLEDWSLQDWLMAATGELGEVAGVLKTNRRRGASAALSEAERAALAHEIADVVIYLDLLAQRAGIALGAAVREKFNIVSDRVGSKVKL